MNVLDRACQGLGPDDCLELVEDPSLRDLKSLTLSANEIGDAGCHTLARAPWAAGLESLVLAESEVGDLGVQSLADAFAALRSLDLMANNLSARALTILAEAPCQQHLETLSLFANWIEEGVPAFVDSPWPSLTSLDLGGNEINEGVASLMTPEAYPALTTLQMANTGMSNDVIDLLSQIPTLRALNIARNPLDHRGLSHLAQASFQLTSFNLAGIPSVDLAQLSQVAALTSLESINLNSAQLDDVRVAPFLQTQWPLRAVSLDSNQLTTASMTPLREAPWAKKLWMLSLCYNNLTDDSIAQLLVNGAFPRLRELDLSENHLTDVGVRTLLQWDGFGHLETLFMSGEGLSTEVARELSEAEVELYWC